MIALLFIGLYISAIIGFCLFDALVGLGYDFDGYKDPPLALVAVFWPIAVPILAVFGFARYTRNLKETRIAKQEHQRQLRVAAEREVETAMKQVEAEIRQQRRL